jgi:hypothetical protein
VIHITVILCAQNGQYKVYQKTCLKNTAITASRLLRKVRLQVNMYTYRYILSMIYDGHDTKTNFSFVSQQ